MPRLHPGQRGQRPPCRMPADGGRPRGPGAPLRRLRSDFHAAGVELRTHQVHGRLGERQHRPRGMVVQHRCPRAPEVQPRRRSRRGAENRKHGRQGDRGGNQSERGAEARIRRELFGGLAGLQGAFRRGRVRHRACAEGRRGGGSYVRQLLPAEGIRRLRLADGGRDPPRAERVRGDRQPPDGYKGVRYPVLQPMREGPSGNP